MLNILGPEIWKPLLEETIKLQFTPIVMVTTYTEHTRSRNMEATFRGNHKLQFTPILMVTTYTEHTRSRNMEATFRGNHKNIVYPSCIGYYIYRTH